MRFHPSSETCARLAVGVLLLCVSGCLEPKASLGKDAGDGPAASDDGSLRDRANEGPGPGLDARPGDGVPPVDAPVSKPDLLKPDVMPVCPAGKECCDGIDNDKDKKVDEGNVCGSIADTDPCPPGAFKPCDCFGGVYRKCQANGTWGPCIVGPTCKPATVTSQDDCTKPGQYCDFGVCQSSFPFPKNCVHHSDCPVGKVCDMWTCVVDPFEPCQS